MTCKVLVVDDERTIRDILFDFLSMEGYTVVTRSDAVGIRDIVEQEKPGCIVMDVAMPWVGGDEATISLTRAGVRVPIILYSAKMSEAEDTLVEYARTLGAVDFIKKPFDLTRVLTAIQKYCGIVAK
jgi:FixJ family two-component response regulator